MFHHHHHHHHHQPLPGPSPACLPFIEALSRPSPPRPLSIYDYISCEDLKLLEFFKCTPLTPIPSVAKCNTLPMLARHAANMQAALHHLRGVRARAGAAHERRHLPVHARGQAARAVRRGRHRQRKASGMRSSSSPLHRTPVLNMHHPCQSVTILQRLIWIIFCWMRRDQNVETSMMACYHILIWCVAVPHDGDTHMH